MKFQIGDKVWCWVLNRKVKRGTITAAIAFKSTIEETNFYLIDEEITSDSLFQKNNFIFEGYIFRTKKECVYSFNQWMDPAPMRSIL